MILYWILYEKNEVKYFMKFIIFLSMIIFTSSKATKLHSSQKNLLQNNYNETLSDQDFEDSLNPGILSEHNYSLPNLLEKSQLLENDLKFQPSTHRSPNAIKKTKKVSQVSKKHRNIIKMVCDSDNLISQMTLHMNFLDSSKEERHHDFVFKKIFKADDPKHEVSFSYPDVQERLFENKSDEPENENDEKSVKEIELSVSKPHNENEALKKDNNINYLLLNEEYEAYPVSKRKKAKTQTYSKDDYKAEIKKFNSGPSIESLKSIRDNYSSNIAKERKKNNKSKFWVTAMAFTETLQNSDLEKNNQLHKLHLSQPSDHLDLLPINTNTSEAVGLIYDKNFSNNDSFIPQVIDNIEHTQSNTQHNHENSFIDKEYDGENKKDKGVLNYSTKFKKYKLANSKHTSDENENTNQSDDTDLYDYPVSYKKQYHNKLLNQDNNQLDKGKKQKKYKAWKNSLIAQPKMKNAISPNRAQVLGEVNSASIDSKKKKILQRQKVIENLKFILSKQRSEHPKTESNLLQQNYFSKEKTKDAQKKLNISKMFGKKNATKVVDISDNQSNNLLFQTDDKETESSSAMEEILLAYQNQNIPLDIYDIDMNDNDVKRKLRNKELFYPANNGNYKKSVNRKDSNSKFEIPYKTLNRITNKRDTHKQISLQSNQLEKYLKSMEDDKGEEIRKGVFLKKGIPLQFDPYKVSYVDNKQILALQTFSPVVGSQRKLRNENEKQNCHAENSLKSKEKENSQSYSENLKTNIKRDLITEDSTYQKACSRFLRDIALIKLLDDKENGDSVFISD